MIYLTGDTHGDFSRLQKADFLEGKKEEDFVIILGDFGLIWSGVESEKERKLIDWLDNQPWTTLFLDGNHENFYRLDKLPEAEKFGGKVGVYSKKIFHLKRGEIYNIDGKTFFTFGGGFSIDKKYRKENVSWWDREIPNYTEQKNGLDNLEKHKWEVDYILTHDVPKSIYKAILNKYDLIEIEKSYNLPGFLEEVRNKTKFKRWYFGHYHLNDNFKYYFTGLWEDIIQI